MNRMNDCTKQKWFQHGAKLFIWTGYGPDFCFEASSTISLNVAFELDNNSLLTVDASLVSLVLSIIRDSSTCSPAGTLDYVD